MKNITAICSAIVIVTGMVSGCSVRQIHKDTVKQSQSVFKDNLVIAHQAASKQEKSFTVPASVYQTLAPVLSNPHRNAQNQMVFDLKVKDMSAAAFLNALMQGLGKSIIVSLGLTQKITLSLNNTTLPKVLNALHDLYGIAVTQTAYGYKATAIALETRIFTLNRINLERTSKSSVSVSTTQLTGDDDDDSSSSNNKQKNINISSASSTAKFWDTVKSTLASLVAKDSGSKVEVNPISGVVIVTAKPSTLKLVANYLQQTQDIMNRQVVIDAKIIEIELSKGFETGIDWSNLGFSSIGSTGVYTLESGISAKSIKAVVTALSSEGQVSVLSSPRVVTMNNQQALIEVGSNQYFVTNVSSGTTPVSGSTATLTSNVDLQPFFSGISLSVLPQINQTGDITLFIHPSITTVTEDTRNIDLSKDQKLSLPLAKSDVRETDSVVRVKSGQVIVLGGLMQNRAKTDAGGLPGLVNLGLKTQNNNSGTVTELVILLKATVPTQQTWINQIKDYQNHYNKILKTYKVPQ